MEADSGKVADRKLREWLDGLEREQWSRAWTSATR